MQTSITLGKWKPTPNHPLGYHVSHKSRTETPYYCYHAEWYYNGIHYKGFCMIMAMLADTLAVLPENLEGQTISVPNGIAEQFSKSNQRVNQQTDILFTNEFYWDTPSHVIHHKIEIKAKILAEIKMREGDKREKLIAFIQSLKPVETGVPTLDRQQTVPTEREYNAWKEELEKDSHLWDEDGLVNYYKDGIQRFSSTYLADILITIPADIYNKVVESVQPFSNAGISTFDRQDIEGINDIMTIDRYVSVPDGITYEDYLQSLLDEGWHVARSENDSAKLYRRKDYHILEVGKSSDEVNYPIED